MKTIQLFATFLAVLFLQLPANRAVAQTTTLNFDSISAGGGVDATSYLASYGITLANVSQPGSIYIISDNNFYGSGVVTAPSPDNFLLQQVAGSPNGISYTLDFSTPLTSLSFTRIAINAPSQVGQWTATAYAGLTPVDSASENFFAGTEGAQIYTLSGSGITSLTIAANGFNTAGISSAPLDDLTLTSVPEPATFALAGMGGLASLGMIRRKS